MTTGINSNLFVPAWGLIAHDSHLVQALLLPVPAARSSWPSQFSKGAPLHCERTTHQPAMLCLHHHGAAALHRHHYICSMQSCQTRVSGWACTRAHCTCMSSRCFAGSMCMQPPHKIATQLWETIMPPSHYVLQQTLSGTAQKWQNGRLPPSLGLQGSKTDLSRMLSLSASGLNTYAWPLASVPGIKAVILRGPLVPSTLYSYFTPASSHRTSAPSAHKQSRSL